MTALDQTAPERLAGIRERDERALRRAEDPAWSLDQAEFDRAVLVAEVDRLSSERDKAAASAKHMGDALTKVGTVMQSAARTAVELGAGAGMDAIIGYLSDAGMLPPEVLAELGDGPALPDESDRLHRALADALATIDRVVNVRRLQHGCTDGTTTELVLVADLRAALGLTADGKAVTP